MANPSNVNRLRDLLSEAVQCLGSAGSSPSTSSSPGTSSQVEQRPAAALVLSSRARAGHIDSERNNLFNFGTRRPKRPKCTNLPKSKKKKLRMWTHDFVCLANKNQKKTPSPLERGVLIGACRIVGVYSNVTKKKV